MQQKRGKQAVDMRQPMVVPLDVGRQIVGMEPNSSKKRQAMSEDINESLKEHETSTEEWEYRDLAARLHEWAERFNVEFKLEIETPAIRIDTIRVGANGTYRNGRNGFGVRHEITLNSANIERPVAEVLSTLLHEILHEWQVVTDARLLPTGFSYQNVTIGACAVSTKIGTKRIRLHCGGLSLVPRFGTWVSKKTGRPHPETVWAMTVDTEPENLQWFNSKRASWVRKLDQEDFYLSFQLVEWL